MSKSVSSHFRKLSNDITAAEDTGNVRLLRDMEDYVDSALSRGRISITEAAELQADITVAVDAIARSDDYLDEGFAAIRQGL